MLRDENIEILHCLQTSLTKVSLARLSQSGHQTANLLPLHQVLTYGSHVLPQLYQFWTQLQGDLAHEGPYQASVGGLRLWLRELQAEDKEARKVREQGLKDGWEENADGVLCHQGLLYMPEIVKTELINKHYDDPLAGHFAIDKTRELIA